MPKDFRSIIATYFSKFRSIFGLYIEQKCSWTFCRHSVIWYLAQLGLCYLMIKFLAGGKAVELNKLYQNIAKCHKFKSRPDVGIWLNYKKVHQDVLLKTKIGYLPWPCPFTWMGTADCLLPLTNTICVSITQYPISGKLFSEQLMYQVMMEKDLLSLNNSMYTYIQQYSTLLKQYGTKGCCMWKLWLQVDPSRWWKQCCW